MAGGSSSIWSSSIWSSSQDPKKRKRYSSDSEVEENIRKAGGLDRWYHQQEEEERKVEEEKDAKFWEEFWKDRHFWEDLQKIQHYREKMGEEKYWEEIQKLCGSMQKEENESMQKEEKEIQKLCKSVEEKKKRRLQFVKEITQKPRSPDLEDRLEKELQDWCDENYDTCTRCGSFLLVEKVGIEACTDCMDIVDEDRKDRVK